MKFVFIIFLFMSQLAAQNGVVKTYYPNGTPRSEISYVNEILDGSAFQYYPNGNVYQERHFSNGVLSGFVREYYESGLLKIEYNVKNGIKNGNQRIYYENGSLKEISVYTDGQRVNVNYFDFDPNYTALPEAYLAGNRQQELLTKKKLELICDVDICPVPIGGLITIKENLIYPEHALLYGLEGIVTLVAKIDTKGDVINTEVIIHLGLGCDEAAQEVVKKTKFIPGQKDGKIVEANVTINVEFKIIDRSLIKYSSTELVSKTSTIVDMNQVRNADEKKKEIANDEENGADKYFRNIVRQIPEIRCEDADVCPYPESGIKSIEKNLAVPFISKRLKLKGEIEIETLIDKYGIVQDTKIIKGIGYGCDEAVESALMRTKFTPAKKSGLEIDSRITVIFPFSYEL